MKYRVVQKVIPGTAGEDKKKMQYANPVNTGRLTIRELSKDIAARTSLSRGDIESVLISFVEGLPTYLKLGLSVQLGDFGTVRLSIKSEGVELDNKFEATKIKGVRIIFTPSSELKNSMGDITFEEERK
ncbi:MAG: DNA-binding protein [Lentimicrobiaceae bacterium]|nr:DNA-binding protein [Lentimicrobiaceae bacterium]